MDAVSGRHLLLEAVDAVDAYRVTAAALTVLAESGERMSGCRVLAFGKAADGMARAALASCDPTGGLVITPTPERWAHQSPAPFEIRRGGHPIPAADAVETGQRVLDWVHGLDERDVLLCLVSGGGSAMLELPVPGVSLHALQDRTRSALRAGADIHALNRERTRLSQLKGGKLARAAAPARVLNVILSDVPGGDLSVVASGPTVPPADEASGFEHVRSEVAADNTTAQDAIVAAAAQRGLRLARWSGYVHGEARDAGAAFYAEARRSCVDGGLDGIVWGGETTVKVVGDGHGGRNQEFVLGAAAVFDGGVLGSLGTDGVDGNSFAAGAWLDAFVLHEASKRNLDPARYLERNDSQAFFEGAGGLIVTGPTGTNVADVCLYLHAPSPRQA